MHQLQGNALKRKQDAFIQNYGTEYVESITWGAQFFILYEFSSSSNSQKREIEASLAANLSGIFEGQGTLFS